MRTWLFYFEIEIVLGNVSQFMIELIRRSFLAAYHYKKLLEGRFSDSLCLELRNGFGRNGRAPDADLSDPS